MLWLLLKGVGIGLLGLLDSTGLVRLGGGMKLWEGGRGSQRNISMHSSHAPESADCVYSYDEFQYRPLGMGMGDIRMLF